MAAIIKKEIGKPTAENPVAAPLSTKITKIDQTVKESTIGIFEKLTAFFASIKESILSLLGRISAFFKQAEPTTPLSPLSPNSMASATEFTLPPETSNKIASTASKVAEDFDTNTLPPITTNPGTTSSSDQTTIEPLSSYLSSIEPTNVICLSAAALAIYNPLTTITLMLRALNFIASTAS